MDVPRKDGLFGLLFNLGKHFVGSEGLSGSPSTESARPRPSRVSAPMATSHRLMASGMSRVAMSFHAAVSRSAEAESRNSKDMRHSVF
jgi:hypothetical protein